MLAEQLVIDGHLPDPEWKATALWTDDYLKHMAVRSSQRPRSGVMKPLFAVRAEYTDLYAQKRRADDHMARLRDMRQWRWRFATMVSSLLAGAAR